MVRAPQNEGGATMEHLRRIRHYGPVTYAAWTAILLAIVFLGGFSVWTS